MSDLIYINARFLTQDLTGVQRHAFEISKVLSDYFKKNIVLLVPKNGEIKSIYNYNFSIKKIGFNTGHIWEQIDLPLYLFKNKSPLLLSFTNTTSICYKNKISTIHDLSIYENKNWFSFQYRALYKFLIPKIIKSSKRILTDSIFSKNEIINRFHIDKDRINVIHCGISFSRDEVDQFKKINDNTNYILFVGSISQRKNLNSLLKAFLNIKDENLILKVVGCSYSHMKSENINNNANVEFLENISNNELITLYSNAKLLIFPSFYEGFGIPPLEAMFCKCPVIASDIPVIKELYGDSVLYIDPYDINSIKDNILLLLHDNKLKDELIRKSAEKIKEYSWIKSGEKVISIIKKEYKNFNF